MYRREEKPDIYLITGPTDFRCGINSLVARLKDMGIDPFENALYVFCCRSKDSLKILYWGGSGFWLAQYRLEKGKFRWLKENGAVGITYKQMEWLLDGLDIIQKRYNGDVKQRVII